jgi:hypothetical protein
MDIRLITLSHKSVFRSRSRVEVDYRSAIDSCRALENAHMFSNSFGGIGKCILSFPNSKSKSLGFKFCYVPTIDQEVRVKGSAITGGRGYQETCLVRHFSLNGR